MKTERNIFIQASLSKVYGVFYCFEHWVNALKDVVGFNIFYDDNIHQSFSMTVLRSGKQETVKGIRFCEENTRIELFQTIPPPSFKTMRGFWEFSCEGNGVRVSAHREFSLLDENLIDGEEEKEKNKINQYLERNLECFKVYIESLYVD